MILTEQSNYYKICLELNLIEIIYTMSAEKFPRMTYSEIQSNAPRERKYHNMENIASHQGPEAEKRRALMIERSDAIGAFVESSTQGSPIYSTSRTIGLEFRGTDMLNISSMIITEARHTKLGLEVTTITGNSDGIHTIEDKILPVFNDTTRTV